MYSFINKVMLIFYYSEILRVIDSVQLTAKYKVATPADWKVRLKIVLWYGMFYDYVWKINHCLSSEKCEQHGTYCMVLPTVKDEDLAELFPAGVEQQTLPSGKGYLRTTPCPDQWDIFGRTIFCWVKLSKCYILGSLSTIIEDIFFIFTKHQTIKRSILETIAVCLTPLDTTFITFFLVSELSPLNLSSLLLDGILNIDGNNKRLVALPSVSEYLQEYEKTRCAWTRKKK